ncbi:MAG: general secretion pathway protein GspK [Desulfovibrionaceae bacterium]|jgi:general secretion pathway protein K|nr:general secretion pathway protein GspK [Desulfovibrionaceae bacterium]
MRTDAARGPRSGAAIILVLVCLLALSSLVLGNQELAFKGAFSARLLAEEYKADLMAESALNVAVELLRRDVDNAYDTPFDRWAQPWQREGVKLRITPENERLDLNSCLSKERHEQALRKMLFGVENSRVLLMTLADWADEDEEERVPGAEGLRYARMWPQYVPRNGPLQLPEELLLVSGWRAAAEPLLDDLTVYGNGRVNLNFVSEKVFRALFPEIESSWTLVENWRRTKGYKSVSEFRDSIEKLSSDDELYKELLQYVTVESPAFRVDIEVDLPLVYERRRYIVQREDASGSIRPVRIPFGHVLELKYKTIP